MKNIFFTLIILAIFYHIASSQSSIKRETFNFKNIIIYSDQDTNKHGERKLMFNNRDGKNIKMITLSKTDRVELSPNKKSVYVYKVNRYDYTKSAIEIYDTKGAIKKQFNIETNVGGLCVNDNGTIVIYGDNNYEGHRSYLITVYNKDGDELIETRELSNNSIEYAAGSVGFIWGNKSFYVVYILMGKYYLNCYRLDNATLEWAKELALTNDNFRWDFESKNSVIADYRNNRLVLIGKDEQGNNKEIFISTSGE